MVRKAVSPRRQAVGRLILARKTKDIQIALEGRDNGKTFRITEMPAVQAEKWAARALLAMSRSGVEIPEEAMSAGAATLLAAGLRSFTSMAFEDAEQLLDEMFGCVEFVTSSGIVRGLIDDDIDEVATRLFLRGEVIEIHTGFSVTATLSTLGAAARARADSSSDTPMSPPLSEQSSGAA
jgi:hypothetical protein